MPSGSFSSPRFSARRHLNTWLAFTPLARATSATLAPGSNVSPAIRRFSDTVRQRRTGRTDPASSATPMTSCSALHTDSCQRGTRDAYGESEGRSENGRPTQRKTSNGRGPGRGEAME